MIMIPSEVFTRERATKVKPVENSFFPSPNLILSRVRPCDLCTVTAQASRRGSCVRESDFPFSSNDVFNGVTGTIGMPVGKPGRGSVCHKVGPLYVLQDTRTASGSSDRDDPTGQMMSSTMPVVALTRPEKNYVCD
jgi:hypothetical protein